MTNIDLNVHPQLLSEQPGRQWWIIAICLLVGGLIGFGLSFLFPPVYEAAFKVTANVQLTDNPEITEIMVDNALMHVGELVYLQPLLDRVIEAEKSQGLRLTPADLRKNSSVERQITTTYLKVRWTDAQTAAQLANTWGMLFYESLQEGAKQAVIADELKQTREVLQNCLAGIQTSSLPIPECNRSKVELETELASLAGRIANAESLSLGLYHGLMVNGYEKATIPDHPVRQERGWLIAAGAGIGLVAGVLTTEIFYSSRKKHLSA
jgi:uncharacterized protein involved in exopolysaccharide biosynthesis